MTPFELAAEEVGTALPALGDALARTTRHARAGVLSEVYRGMVDQYPKLQLDSGASRS